eukprot:CAMPEP_0116890784 /NCGR_PEP_ID=MMETSP0467-20121206/1302_1 /TAXON_ID=283647 /ORGANISM="Mesodinium pulex, Strain SPMC105" /LENGTH=122 /DNA_ID=CAMNT_0004558849 /DNA_START=1930 /DNA_END=2298 /DNA_ORIENTATION=-
MKQEQSPMQTNSGFNPQPNLQQAMVNQQNVAQTPQVQSHANSHTANNTRTNVQPSANNEVKADIVVNLSYYKRKREQSNTSVATSNSVINKSVVSNQPLAISSTTPTNNVSAPKKRSLILKK